MTNAEKIAKDIDLMVELIDDYDCCAKDCNDCVLRVIPGFCIGCCPAEALREWLESEAEE